MGFIRIVVAFIITVLTLGFAVMNRQDVTLVWSPFHEHLTLPLFIVALATAATGFLFGACLIWLNGGRGRREKRKQKREIKSLQKELESLKSEKIPQAQTPALELFPESVTR